MNSVVKLSIQEILKNKKFKHSKVVAGKNGIYRMVKWVHVMEVTDIGNLLNGNELILSTGIGWNGKKEIFLSLVKQFIDFGVSGLCIELGKYITTVPEEIIELANKHDFPIILFEQEVRFIDITQEIHTLLMKKHYKMISDLEETEEAEWLQKWLEGVHSDEQVERYLTSLETAFQSNGCVVLLCQLGRKKNENVDVVHLKVMFRSTFQQQGFLLLTIDKKNDIVFILVDKRKSTDWKRRIETGINIILNTEFILNQEPDFIQLSVGKFSKQLSQVNRSYQTAKETQMIKERMPNEVKSYFYQDLHSYRLVIAAHEQGIIKEFISDYLQSIIDYDQNYNGKLLETLKLYLQCNGSKKETAKQLFIVRQTLYHRLDKLTELLGEDFMSPLKRQAVEFAILCYDYLHAYKS